jgi:hypothetical protein
VIHHIAWTKTEPVEIAGDSGVPLNEDRAVVEARGARVENDDSVAAPQKKSREILPGKPGAPGNDVTHARIYAVRVMKKRPPQMSAMPKTRRSVTFSPRKKNPTTAVMT